MTGSARLLHPHSLSEEEEGEVSRGRDLRGLLRKQPLIQPAADQSSQIITSVPDLVSHVANMANVANTGAPAGG